MLRALLVTALALAAAPASASAAVELVTPGADAVSGAASVSGSGRYVAFASEASTLVPGDTNGASDVFVRDRLTGTTTRVSGGAGPSGAPSISGDGRIVAFASRSPDLVPGDVNGRGLDVYVHDRATGVTRRLAPGAGLYQSFDPSVSAEGGHVAFAAERVQRGEEKGDLVEAGPRRVYVAVLSSGAVGRASVTSREHGASDSSFEPAMAAGGGHVAFTSRASDLAAGDDDLASDVYVRDLRRGRTRRVSRGSAGTSLTSWATAPSISADGDLVAFQLSSTDLVEEGGGPVGQVMVRKRTARATWVPEARRSGFPALSGDGRIVAFTSARTGRAEIYADGPLR